MTFSKAKLESWICKLKTPQTHFGALLSYEVPNMEVLDRSYLGQKTE